MKSRRTVSLVSLGCPKNLVDSESMVSLLMARDFDVVAEPRESELVIVNTCGFLDASRRESLDTIREMVGLKDAGSVKGVFVAGCMVGNYRELLDAEAPGVDRLVGFGDYARLDRIADELLPPPEARTFTSERRRIDAALTPAHYAYLKISEGCNHTCAFCVIPDIRGPMQSRPLEDLVARARGLGERGVKEISLIAQDSTAYGADLYGKLRLPELLRRLDGVSELTWIRLMYAYPTEVREELAEILGSGQRVLPYLDVPIQHASDTVLKRMRRGYGRRDLDRMIQDLRRHAPDVALRTTVIVGFPGETEEDFEQLLDYLRASRFDRLGAFKYSREEGSRAESLDDQVEEAVKEERFHRLMSLQQEIAFARNRELIGSRETILIDAAASSEGRPARGRSRRDAPEVDAAVLIDDPSLRPGDLVEVEITGQEGYDLRARPCTAV